MSSKSHFGPFLRASLENVSGIYVSLSVFIAPAPEARYELAPSVPEAHDVR